VGEDWVPGSNLPFDPIATRHAAKIGLRVIAAGGKNMENLSRILAGEDFVGTTIGPD
jgi:uridylate kinase